jgi:hypothetical protein
MFRNFKYRPEFLKILFGVILSLGISTVISANEYSISGDKTIRLPFRYVQSFIILDVQLEKFLPIKLIFDTGAEHTIIFEKNWTDIIANAYVRELKVIGSDLMQELPALLTAPLNLRFEGRHEFVSPLIVLKDNSTNISQVIGESVQGILSASIFNRYLIEIDYKNQWISLHPNGYIIPPDYKKTDIEIYKNKPYLRANINNKNNASQTLNLLLDTGASLSLLIYSDSSSVTSMPDKIIPGYLGSGLGGMLTGFVGKINRMGFDTFLLPGVITHFLKIQTPIARNEALYKNGLIGNQILDKFRIILDYQNQKLYLKPQKNYKQVLSYDKSGILIISGGSDLQKFYVAYVVPGTPAAEAGLMENDQIVKINGWPAGFFSLAKLSSMLQAKDGKKIKLTIKREGKRMKFSFLLKELI